jgi:LacI family transcriptional regulator
MGGEQSGQNTTAHGLEMDSPKILLQLDVSRACGRKTLQGICKYANSFTNWHLITAQPFYLMSLGDEKTQANHPLKKIDAIITDTLASAEKHGFLKIPIIGLNLQGLFSDAPNIRTNEEEIAEIAFDYFRNLGFERFAYCGFEGLAWSQRRRACFGELIKSIGCKMSSFSVAENGERFIPDDVMTAIAEWIKGQGYPLALFACNDDCAKLVAEACKTGGIQVPHEVSILGVDNDEAVCLTAASELSSISLDFEKAGFDAATRLRKILSNKCKDRTPIIINPVEVVSRKSTDSSAVKDPTLRKCLQFIHQNINRNIGVPEVVDISYMSRRSLEQKFKQDLGMSIYKHIRRSKVRHISSLLIKTNLTIAQISYDLDFPEPEHLSRYFKAETGISPNEFRKRYKVGSARND